MVSDQTVPVTEAEISSSANLTTTETSATDCIHFLDITFMLESENPSKRERYHYSTPDGLSVTAVLDIVDDEPGATQSGHYLWPASTILAQFLVNNYPSEFEPITVVELGAGNGLPSCIARQLWAAKLQCLVVTDHDPSTLQRARNNYNMTLESLTDEVNSTRDAPLKIPIESLDRIPTWFESLEWGKEFDVQSLQELIVNNTCPQQQHIDIILGADLIYDVSVVEPLLRTVRLLILGGKCSNVNSIEYSNPSSKGRFFLSQSFEFDEATNKEIKRCCLEMSLVQTIVQTGIQRIREFRLDSSKKFDY